MITVLPQEIKTIEAAQEFLAELKKNREDFHPEDDAHSISWSIPVTEQEKDKLNDLMRQIYLLGNFDPCEFLVSLYSNE